VVVIDTQRVTADPTKPLRQDNSVSPAIVLKITVEWDNSTDKVQVGQVFRPFWLKNLADSLHLFKALSCFIAK
jgi:hypothetical protein